MIFYCKLYKHCRTLTDVRMDNIGEVCQSVATKQYFSLLICLGAVTTVD